MCLRTHTHIQTHTNIDTYIRTYVCTSNHVEHVSIFLGETQYCPSSGSKSGREWTKSQNMFCIHIFPCFQHAKIMIGLDPSYWTIFKNLQLLMKKIPRNARHKLQVSPLIAKERWLHRFLVNCTAHSLCLSETLVSFPCLMLWLLVQHQLLALLLKRDYQWLFSIVSYMSIVPLHHIDKDKGSGTLIVYPFTFAA